jgi:Leucine-rich repeat (LRR) protein
MKNNSGNPNLLIKSDKKLPNIAQTNQLIQHAKVNDKALSNILNSRDPEYWLKKVREALDNKAWTEAIFYGQKVLFYNADFVKADIVLAYAFGRLWDFKKSIFHIERVDRFREVEAEVYRSLLSTTELYFLSIFFDNSLSVTKKGNCELFSKKLENIAQPLKLELSKVAYEKLKTILIDRPNIHFLKIRHYEGGSLPKGIGQLTNLTYLGLIGNHILNLNSNKLTVLPKEIGQLTNLSILDLNSNKLTVLPKEIGQLTNLSILNLYGNKLTILPKEIGQLTNLSILHLNSNKLTVLPKEIEQLANLTSFHLDYNNLTSLPKEIGQLTNLTFLHLRKNQLTSLPKEIGQLTNLTSLDLRVNRLTILPKEIGQLTNLTELHLGGNNFSDSEVQRIRHLLPNCSLSFNHPF